MTGAGFGGCAVALVGAPAADDFVQTAAAAYRETTGRTPAIYVCQATNGAEVVAGG
jgi:galactokinase